MTENTFLVVDADGLARNAVVWNGETPFDEPGCQLIPRPTEPAGVWIGWTYTNGQWTPPTQET